MPDAKTTLQTAANDLQAIATELANINDSGMSPADRVDFQELKGRTRSLSADVAAAAASLTAHVVPGVHAGQTQPSPNAFDNAVKKAAQAKNALHSIDRNGLGNAMGARIDALESRAVLLSDGVVDAQGRNGSPGN